MKLRPDHILWESVRRNDRYKKWYEKLEKAGLSDVDLQFSKYDSELEELLTILDVKENNNWLLLKPYDPNISVFDIEEKTNREEMTYADFPYSHLFSMFNPEVIEVGFPEYNISNSFKGTYSIEMLRDISYGSLKDVKPELIEILARWAATLLFENKDRILISISPFSSSKAIGKEINRLKEENLKAKGKESKSINKDSAIYLTKTIEDMRHLTRYDRIKSYIQEKKDLIYETDGEVFLIPDNIHWPDIVSKKEVNDFFKNQTGAKIIDTYQNDKGKVVYTPESIEYANQTIGGYYEDSYPKAVMMIKRPLQSIGVVPHRSSRVYGVNW